MVTQVPLDPVKGRQRSVTNADQAVRAETPHQRIPVPKSKSRMFDFPKKIGEPSVPAHIRSRLRLIHHLGVILGVNAAGISSKIDVPALLAKVDATHDKLRNENASTQTSSLPIGNGNLVPVAAPVMRPNSDIGDSGMIEGVSPGNESS